MVSSNTISWMSDNGFSPDDLNSRSRYDDTALILASRQGLLEIVKDLIHGGAKLNGHNMDGTNALWAACVADSFPIAELLLKHGIKLDHQNDHGATVLMYAASSGKQAWVEYLLNAGADLSLRSLDGFDALDLASSFPILKLLDRR